MLGSGPGRAGYCLSVRQTAADSTKTQTTLFMLIWKPIKLIKGERQETEKCASIILVRHLKGVLIHADTRIYKDMLLVFF